jgi:hypothetical protein
MNEQKHRNSAQFLTLDEPGVEKIFYFLRLQENIENFLQIIK